jgi:hypothetical protein
LKRDRVGQWSIRINDQWRVCFRFEDGHAYDVEIVVGKRAVTVDTGLRLSRFFGTSDGFWIGLQTDYDTAQAKDALSDVLSRIHRFEPVHV